MMSVRPGSSQILVFMAPMILRITLFLLPSRVSNSHCYYLMSGPHLTFKRLGCESAIRQITYYLDVVGPTNQQAERLYAISAVGKKWRAVYVGKGKGSRGVKGIATVNSLRSADLECWNEDITSEVSWEVLKGIVETIKGYNT